MKYDDASWHYGGDFPKELPDTAGATHIGMFVTWCLLNELAGTLHTEEFPDDFEKLRNRQVTPGEFLINACDEKFTDEDLNETGKAFAEDYFASKNGFYLTDYEAIFGAGHTTLYHVEDSWVNFDRIAATIDRRFEKWKNGKLQLSDHESPKTAEADQKPWWKFC